MGSPETHTAEIEEESVSNEPEPTADLHDESISHVPEGSEVIDTPDIDLATEVPQEKEPEGTEEAEPEEEAAAEAAEEAPEEEVEEHPEVSKEALEKEIKELKEKARQAQEKWEHWRDASRDARAAHFQGREVEPTVELPPGQQVPTVEPPKEDDFEDYNMYVEALTDFKVEHKLAEYDLRSDARAADDAHAAKRANLVEKLEIGREKYSDFDEVVHDPIVPITEGIVDILADTEYPAEIAYFLATNLSQATQISRMPPAQAALAIGKIEARIAADEDKPPSEPAPTTPTVTKKTTTAPAPITPVKPGGGSVVTKDRSKMSNEEYRASRKAEMARK